MAHAEISRLTLEIGALVDPNRVRQRAAEALACETVIEPKARRRSARSSASASAIESRSPDRRRAQPRESAPIPGRDRPLAGADGPRSRLRTRRHDGRRRGRNHARRSQRSHGGRIASAFRSIPPTPESVTLGATDRRIQGRSDPAFGRAQVRDLLIGIQFVGHGGRIARAGGRVVKNVAGYDLMKVLTGSFGTLGIVTEAAFKVRPTTGTLRAGDRAIRSDRGQPSTRPRSCSTRSRCLISKC